MSEIPSQCVDVEQENILPSTCWRMHIKAKRTPPSDAFSEFSDILDLNASTGDQDTFSAFPAARTKMQSHGCALLSSTGWHFCSCGPSQMHLGSPQARPGGVCGGGGSHRCLSFPPTQPGMSCLCHLIGRKCPSKGVSSCSFV